MFNVFALPGQSSAEIDLAAERTDALYPQIAVSAPCQLMHQSGKQNRTNILLFLFEIYRGRVPVVLCAANDRSICPPDLCLTWDVPYPCRFPPETVPCTELFPSPRTMPNSSPTLIHFSSLQRPHQGNRTPRVIAPPIKRRRRRRREHNFLTPQLNSSLRLLGANSPHKH